MGRRKICCMFDREDPCKAVAEKDLEEVLRLEYTYRKKKGVYRCRHCGALVYYEYEEIANWNGNWDNADVIERYIPTREGELEKGYDGLYFPSIAAENRRYIYGHNLELDDPFQYYYVTGWRHYLM